MSNEYRIETKCIQSGWKPKKGEPDNDAYLSEYNF